ncbi:MAG: N-acetyltransferase family protein [Clostridia bacterium]|nr:GNAT family N-acetyltransferase [Lachnospiraceae bacterium]NCC00657.1 N-acetyltransferase family protein [Clostridia bacterium]NCD02669.1 N-acetyltransferase family protein [Clostridia bacterium]
MILQLIKEEDIAEVLEIYTPYILNTCITYEYDVPSLESFSERVNHYTEQYPWIVAKDHGKIVGYAYASTYRGREAYQWCCELSVYLRSEYQGIDLGRTLYSALMDLLTLQGYYTVYGVISLPNEASIALHNQLGFTMEGVQKNSGFKHGEWHHTAIMSKALQDYTAPETAPKSIGELPQEVINAILTKGPVH